MGIVTVDKNTGNNFKDNDDPHDMDFTTSYREFRPPYQARMDYRAIVAVAFSGVVIFLILCIVYAIWKLFYCWGSYNLVACNRLNNAEPIIALTLFGLVVSLTVWIIAERINAHNRQTRAIANRTNNVLDRYGNQVPADLFARMTPQETVAHLMQRYMIDTHMQQTVAPYQLYKGVNSLSINNTTKETPLLNTASVASNDMLKPIPSSEWINWINEQPHVILAGATGTGKTVTSKPIIAPRIAANEQLIVIDPHSDYWFGLDVYGMAENWQEVKSVIDAVNLEYVARLNIAKEYMIKNNRKHDPKNFTRLTIVLDEAYLASQHLDNAKRGSVSTWDMFSSIFSSGARKTNISLILVTQTTNVDDLGITGELRANFTRIAVSDRAIKLMISQEEKDSKRREMLYAALIDMQYPAVSTRGASVVLLDRTGLDKIPDPTVQPSNNWPFVRSQNTENDENDTSRTHERNENIDIITRLRQLRAQGVTRYDAHHVYGLRFTDSDWKAT